MSKRSLGLLIIAAPLLFPGHPLQAKEEVSGAIVGDAEAGSAKSVTCQACHGADGRGIAPEFPNLAGQVSGYIAAQLASYKSTEPDSRNNPVMLGMVGALSEQDMADLDAYYASLPPIQGAVSEADVEEARMGEKLYRGGYRDLEIPACMACHGPSGHGIPTLYPRLAGQSAGYLEIQLNAFKTKARPHDVMAPIAFKLTPEQIRQVSLFLTGLN